MHTITKEVLEPQLFTHHEIIVDPGQEPFRVDKFLVCRLPNLSRNKIQLIISNDFVLVNEIPVKANYKVKSKDVVKVAFPNEPRDTEVVPENLPIDIEYEDEEILIVNKLSGMVVHPAYNNWTGTLVNALAYHFKNLPNKSGNVGRPGLVHRLDKDTSGLLVIAKTEESMVFLAKQFYDHSIERTYNALVWGDVKEDNGTIDTPLSRSPKDRRIVITTEDELIGKKAITHYKVIKRYGYVTLIECKLETGRTHQIRAHLKSIGHTLFGDKSYGGDLVLKGPSFSKYKSFIINCFKIMPRQALHAKSLGFIHPQTKEIVRYDSPLPDDFSQVLEKWDRYTQ